MVDLWIDDFESNTGVTSQVGVTRSAGNHTDTANGSVDIATPADDYSVRTDGSTPAGFDFAFTGFTGFYWRAEDLDGIDNGFSGGAVDAITYTGIDISGQTNLGFSGLFAADHFDDNGIAYRFETDDYIRVEVQIDGGGFVTILELRGDLASGGLNGNMSVDTNNDGIGDGLTLGHAAQLLTAAIAGTGNLLDLRVSFRLDGANEEIAFDELKITAGPAGPTAGNDNLTGTAGNDIIDLLAGDDIYDGGAGDDQIMGGAGADTLDGGDGFDYTQYNNAASGVSLSLISGGSVGDAAGDTFANIEGAVGSNFNDVIGGSNVDNTLFGLDGDDRLLGLDGNDLLVGGNGNDKLFGGAGADKMLGGAGFDSVYYVTATSAVVLSLASGGTVGEAAGDSFGGIEQVFATSFNDIVVGSVGDETLNGLDGNDVLSGAAGNDTLNGGNGDDVLFGGEGADTLSGGQGIDTVSYATSRSGVTVNLTTNVNSGGDAAGDVLTSIEKLFGSRFGDVLTGDIRDNTINGLAGNDVINGEGGADILYAGAGSDILNGGAGDDILSGQSGFNQLNGGSGFDIIYGGSGQDFINGGVQADILFGGMGNDRFIFEENHGADQINDFQQGLDKIELIGTGQSFADLLINQVSNNVHIISSLGTIVLINQLVDDFDASDFIFTDAMVL